MELPKIPRDQLTPQLKKIVGNKDLEFDSIVDPMDVIDINFNSDEYRVIKLAKNNPHLYSRSDVLYAKLIKKATKSDSSETGTVDTKKDS